MAAAIGTIFHWVETGQPNYVCVRDVHGVMRSRKDRQLLQIHEQAGLVTPDGMPLVWIARWRGHRNVSRVCGADLMAAVCRQSVARGTRHYFYGGKQGVAERLACALQRRHPGLVVAGARSPPFRALTPSEDAEETAHIAATGPQIVWVGLSSPKQEAWMHRHVGRIPGATLIGVGAAFDFLTGDVKRAPRWMQRSGLEWLHRLCCEPRRLWRRYCLMAPHFALLLARQEIGWMVHKQEGREAR